MGTPAKRLKAHFPPYSCSAHYLSVASADLVAAERTPGRRRCSRCSSSVCAARTPSPSGSPAPRRLAPAASGAEEDTGRSSGAVWTGGGWGTRNPERQRREIIILGPPSKSDTCSCASWIDFWFERLELREITFVKEKLNFSFDSEQKSYFTF